MWPLTLYNYLNSVDENLRLDFNSDGRVLKFLVFACGIFNRGYSFDVMACDVLLTYKLYAVNCCLHLQSAEASQIAENCSCYLFSYCPPSPFFWTTVCTFRFSCSHVFFIICLFYLPAVGLFSCFIPSVLPLECFIFRIYEASPESIKPFWISREPVLWPWCNLAASQRRPCCPSAKSHAPVGLVSWQRDAVDWACVLCDRRIHKSHPFQRRFYLWEKPEVAGSQIWAVGVLADVGDVMLSQKKNLHEL